MPVAMGETLVINLREALKIVLDQGVEQRCIRITGVILADRFGIHILHNQPGGNFAKVSGNSNSQDGVS
jgi:hypothetical protein